MTDLAAFGEAAAEGTPLVGWLRHPAWGPLPLDQGRFAVVAVPGPGGRRFVAHGEVRTPDGPRQLVVSFDLPVTGRLAALRRAEVALALRMPDGASVSEGRAALPFGDLARLALSFEPSGAHDLRDRVRAARETFDFLRRR